MKIASITIHNFRSILDMTVSVGNYTLLTGSNNVGKSNVVDALRVFYEAGIKYEESRDFPKMQTADKDSWIEISFCLDEIELLSLKAEYRQSNGSLRVRKVLQADPDTPSERQRPGIYGYEGQVLSSEPFYGAKNVQQGKLGRVIYIPATSRLDEHTKMSGPSILRELVGDILKRSISLSPAFRDLQSHYASFARSIKSDEGPTDGRSIDGLEGEINAELNGWEAKCQFIINDISESEMAKGMMTLRVFDQQINAVVDTDRLGHGFQRHLIFTLMKVSANLDQPTTSHKKNDFQPDMTLVLFEEPEAFLHPPQQAVLSRALRRIGTQTGRQVLITTHSPQFVSRNSNDIPSLVRLCREGQATVAGQISSDALGDLFETNREVIDIVNKHKKSAPPDAELTDEMESIKYYVWLDSERSGLFFAPHVLLVEGATERCLINHLLDSGDVPTPDGGVFVLDCMGKYCIHRFMNLLAELKVSHSVLFDGDANIERDPELHRELGQLIQRSRNTYTRRIEVFSDDIERFLEIPKAKLPHQKPQHLMYLWRKPDAIQESRKVALTFLLNEILRPSSQG